MTRIGNVGSSIKIGLRKPIDNNRDFEKLLRKNGYERDKKSELASQASFSIIQRISSHTITPETKNFKSNSFRISFTKSSESYYEHFVSVTYFKPLFKYEENSAEFERMVSVLASILQVDLQPHDSDFEYFEVMTFISILLDGLSGDKINTLFNSKKWIQKLGGREVEPFGTRVSGPGFHQVAFSYYPDIAKDMVRGGEIFVDVKPIIHDLVPTRGANFTLRFELNDIRFLSSSLRISKSESLRAVEKIFEE
jgi:hypothetical protein